MDFREISPKLLTDNLFEKISDAWFLIGVGKEGHANCVTASWGMAGVLWNRPMFTVFVRPQRYTMGLISTHPAAAFSFLPETFRPVLSRMGKISGRDTDKIADSGLSPVYRDGAVYFREADLVILGEKRYLHPMTEKEFLSSENVKRYYPARDFHVAVTYEITAVLKKENQKNE